MLIFRIILNKIYCILLYIFIYRALQDLSNQLQNDLKNSENNELRTKVEAHWNHISTQISRLKLLKVRMFYWHF